jgi:hypothetical protein
MLIKGRSRLIGKVCGDCKPKEPEPRIVEQLIRMRLATRVDVAVRRNPWMSEILERVQTNTLRVKGVSMKNGLFLEGLGRTISSRPSK